MVLYLRIDFDMDQSGLQYYSFLSAIKDIPYSYYEAAKLDGANPGRFSGR